jgi:hypothetical protein
VLDFLLEISIASPIGTLDTPIFRHGWLALSAERNADGYRLQCLARALVRVALFVIALRKRLALVDGDAARDHPPLIGNGLRDPIADETLAGLVLSGHAVAASSGLGLIMLVANLIGLAGLLPYERLSLLGSSQSASSRPLLGKNSTSSLLGLVPCRVPSAAHGDLALWT